MRNSDRLGQLVNDLLDMDKLNSGEMHIDRDVIDLNDLVRTAVETNQPYAARYGVTLLAETAQAPVRIEGDMHRLAQVAANLISNAVKYSPAGGMVRVGSAFVQGQGRFSVIDQGPGIPEQFRKKLFKRFAQADGSDRRSHDGTGLGLSITKAIVDRHGGAISLDTGEGKGTRFDIDFKIFNPAVLAGETATRTVLICQRNECEADSIRRIVTRGNAACDTATSVDEAMRLVSSHRYDLIVADAGMVDRAGLSLTCRLETQDTVLCAPVFLTSAEARHQQALHSHGINVVDWIETPVDLPRIARALAQSARQDNAKCRILHVEDAPCIASQVAASLSGIAHVDAATDLATAKALLARETYDVMIVDVGLPDGSGLDLLPIAAELPGRPIAVIVFSSDEDRDKVSPSVHKFLAKSGESMSELVDTVRALSQVEKS